MKTKKLYTSGQVVSAILMVIGAGAMVGFFATKRNRIKTQKKAKEIGGFIVDKVNAEKKRLGNKVMELMQKPIGIGFDLKESMSKYDKKNKEDKIK
ncbi:hypothetical protein [Mongoliitalea lutea]|uniref:Uncharacterized protein n=1 Tax=Mongoliitalea lutea TaxID=849756 RepID=A0A8J3CWU8_9BACT|nr:hypothetical protein [Mongoliitalea lutea]GHB35028.1 hypothetical protein GCM10008106_15500 [Mongoliitalea lutea]